MRPEYYRQYAFDCLRMANNSSDPETQAMLVDMAQAWLKLAGQAISLRRKNYGYLTLISDRTKTA
jgi:hypothetical protein